MKLFINKQLHDLPEGATLAQAAEAIQAVPPFAAAVNMQFVPKTQHAITALHEGDRVEIIRPVTGG